MKNHNVEIAKPLRLYGIADKANKEIIASGFLLTKRAPPYEVFRCDEAQYNY